MSEGNVNQTVNGDPAGGETDAPKNFSQEEVDRIIAQRLTREREKFGDYDEIKKGYAALQEEKRKRDEAEKTELERANTQILEMQSEVERLKGYEQRWTEFEQKQREQVAAKLEKLTPEHQEIINAIPDPVSQLKAIAQFEQPAHRPGITAQQSGQITGVLSLTDIEKLRKTDPVKWRTEYEKYRKNKGY